MKEGEKTSNTTKNVIVHSNLKKKHFVNKPGVQNTSKSIRKPTANPKIKGRMPIPEAIRKKYDKGEALDKTAIRTKTHQKKLDKKEQNIKFTTEISARTEILLTEPAG